MLEILLLFLIIYFFAGVAACLFAKCDRDAFEAVVEKTAEALWKTAQEQPFLWGRRFYQFCARSRPIAEGIFLLAIIVLWPRIILR